MSPTDGYLGSAASSSQVADFFAPTPLELHAGVVVGSVADGLPYPAWPHWRAEPAADPRAALEAVITPYVRTGRCAVQFSGGRDSSLVLAVAALVARREGLPPPVAATVRYPDHPDTQETDWQELVAGHLGVPLVVTTVRDGDDELAGPLGCAQLRRHGPVYPAPGAVSIARVAQAVPGHAVLTGEGGDDVLGPQRVTWLRAWKRKRLQPQDGSLRFLRDELAPRAVRRRLTARAVGEISPWLREPGRATVVDALARQTADESLDWRRGTWDFLNRRMLLGLRTLRTLAELSDVTLAHPLCDPTFVEAVCRRAGYGGLLGRTMAMRLLAADLLPDEILARTTKARFNNVYAGHRVRSFAKAWTGGGVDDSLVDVESLRREWQREVIPAPSMVPLQLALLDAMERGWGPDGSVPR